MTEQSPHFSGDDALKRLWKGVPSGWNLKRMKVVLGERSEKGFPDLPLLAATQSKGVVRKEDYENRTVVAQKDLHLLKLVEVGDFVISLRSFQGGIERAHHRGIISPAYTVLYPRKSSNADYLAYLFKSRPFLELLRLNVTGIREGQNIDYTRLSRELIPVPPLKEQEAIVRYLDRAASALDDAISANTTVVQLLEEERRAVVAEAVLGTATSESDLAPSSLVWADKLPESWNLKRMKVVLEERSQKGFPDLPLLAATQSKGVVRKEDYENRTVVAQKDLHLLKLVEVGDFVISLRSFQGGIERAHHRGIISPAYTVLYPRKSSNADYLAYLFKSRPFLELLRLNVTGIREGQNIDYTRLSRELIPVPPPNEQDAIVRYLDAEAKRIDTSIANARRQLELLEEYRTVLIADAVTGKLDVSAADSRTQDTVAEEAVEAAAAGESP